MNKKFRQEVEEIKNEMSAMDIIDLTDRISCYSSPVNNPNCVFMDFFPTIYDIDKNPSCVAKMELINQMMNFVLCEDGYYRFIDK